MPNAHSARRTRKSGKSDHVSPMDGFYARDFQPDEIEDLEAALSDGLSDEIAMLRVVTRRVFSLAKGVDDLKEAYAALNALSIASTRLANLLKTQMALGGAMNEQVFEAISEALTEVMEEMRPK